MALELRKNKFKEVDKISKEKWIEIGLMAGLKKSIINESWELTQD